MEKGKIIPLALGGLLFLLTVILFVSDSRHGKFFSKLIITYRDQKYEYTKIKVDDVIVVKDVSFWVVSKGKNAIVLNSNQNLKYKNKDSNEFDINMNKSTEVCFEEDNCIIFELI